MKKRISYKTILCIGLIICITGIIVMTSTSSVNAAVATKPAFEVKINSISPEFPKVGEDITVSGEIIPKDFESEIPEKEIVLVLDVSGSMDDSIYVECTNERVRYCIAHNSSNPNHSGWWEHNWKEDYCIEHKKSGDHTTRLTKISELKKAAKNFVEKMKDVPNLKIGIVAYSTEATINPNGKNGNKSVTDIDRKSSHSIPNYISSGDKFIDIDDSRLISMIDGLEALGGTNTGEGLRKAQYMLKGGNSDANKTIVLMSDGLPTFYSVASKNKDFYKDINNTNPGFAGSGSSMDNMAVSYSTTIGSVIKGTANNVFSIGYGLGDESSTDNKTLKSIHESMGGTDNNFFASNDGAIDSVFQQIADEILATYAINNVKMEMNFTDGFTLSMGGNTVGIDNILYKTDGKVKDGKVTYKAEPVPFKFIVKGAKQGYHDLWASSTVSFPWKGEIITAPVPKISINIDKNELPNIKAKLTSPAEVEAIQGDNIEVTYDIIADEFIYNDINNAFPKDVAIVVDVSNDDNNMKKLTNLKNSLWGKLINSSILADKNIRYSIITYSNEAQVINDLTDNKAQLDSYIKKISVSNSSDKNIGKGILSAKRALDKGRDDANKYIIFIASGKISYNTEDLAGVKGSEYNIISLGLESGETSLKSLHIKELGRPSNDYLFSSEGNGNDINNNLMSDIAGKIAAINYKPYKVDTSLRLNLGDNFNVVKGFETVDGNNVTIKIPTITYEHVSGGKYVAKTIEPVKFTITPKPDKYGELLFGGNNVIAYKNLLKEEVTKAIQTPKINVISPVLDLRHGLDNGLSNSGYSITEGEVRIANDMKVNVASVATILSSNVNVELRINNTIDLKDLNKIKVYIIKDNKLVELKCNITSIGAKGAQNCYNIKLPEGIKGETEVVVRYQCKMSKDNSGGINNFYENNILFNKEERIFRLKGEALPDLF